MKIFKLSKFALLFGVSTPALSVAEDSFLQLNSNVPEIAIEVRTSDKFAIRLPVLQYVFRVTLHCKNDQSPQSLMLSVADSRTQVFGNDLQTRAEITLKIPPDQIAPVSAQGFCLSVVSDDSTKVDQITMHGAFSAQASLVCADDSSQQIIYSSLALDLLLKCDKNELPTEN